MEDLPAVAELMEFLHARDGWVTDVWNIIRRTG